MTAVVLASTSPYRRELLGRLGIPFTAVAPACDEDALKDPALAPQALAERLAEAKALSLAGTQPDAAVIGSDQVCALESRILGKPGTPERAREQLAALAGREHRLITAVAIAHRGRVHRHTSIARLRMRALTADEIARYVERDRPTDCAGSYKLERAGIALFDAIDCDDHTAITGLPLLALCALLRTCGVIVP